MPRRMSSWSSATRILSLPVALIISGNRHSYRRAHAARINFKAAAGLLHTFVHAGNSDSCSRSKSSDRFQSTFWDFLPFIADLDRDAFRVAHNSYPCLAASRVALDVREAFLDHSK